MDTASTSDAVTFITYVQSLKRKIKQFEKQVEVSSGRRFLGSGTWGSSHPPSSAAAPLAKVNTGLGWPRWKELCRVGELLALGRERLCALVMGFQVLRLEFSSVTWTGGAKPSLDPGRGPGPHQDRPWRAPGCRVAPGPGGELREEGTGSVAAERLFCRGRRAVACRQGRERSVSLCLSKLYRNGQRLLEKQRFQFPPSWLYIDNIEGEWGAFNDIMRRKDSAIQQQVANLQMKIVQEDRAVESRTTDLLADWEKTKPVTVSLARGSGAAAWPGASRQEALLRLSVAEGRLCRLSLKGSSACR